MRRRSRSYGRRKVPQQWVCSTQGYNASGTFTPAVGPQVITLAAASGVAASFDPPIIQRFTIQRVLASVHMAVLDTSAVTFAPRMVGIGIAVARVGTVLDPVSQTDGGYPWMYIRHVWLPGGQTIDTGSPARGEVIDWALKLGPQIDVKSKRVVHEGEALYMYLNVAQPLVSDGCGFNVFVRTLIRKVA